MVILAGAEGVTVHRIHTPPSWELWMVNREISPREKKIPGSKSGAQGWGSVEYRG
jgi:hypothetical protein